MASLQTSVRCLELDLLPLSSRGVGHAPGGPVVSAQTYTISDVQQLPLPAGVMVVEPPGGYVLAEVPVNVYAVDGGSSDLSTVVLGIPVVVRVTPASWSWSWLFGMAGRWGRRRILAGRTRP